MTQNSSILRKPQCIKSRLYFKVLTHKTFFYVTRWFFCGRERTNNVVTGVVVSVPEVDPRVVTS